MDGWLATGDAAVITAEGPVRLVDRFKDMYISGGENVYPAEVEAVLYQHAAVAECAVIGVPDAKWGEIGHAFVVRHGATISSPTFSVPSRGTASPATRSRATSPSSTRYRATRWEKF